MKKCETIQTRNKRLDIGHNKKIKKYDRKRPKITSELQDPDLRQTH